MLRAPGAPATRARTDRPLPRGRAFPTNFEGSNDMAEEEGANGADEQQRATAATLRRRSASSPNM